MTTFVTFHIDPNKKTADRIFKENNMKFDYENNYVAMIDMLFRSVSIFHFDCKKVVLTDFETNLSSLPNDIDIFRMELDPEQVMLSRLRSQIHYVKNHDLSSDLVLLDSDMLINGNLNSLFEQCFDIGLTYRGYRDMPINGGIIFIPENGKQQAASFLEKAYNIYKSNYYEHSTWWGDQYALIEAIGHDNFFQRSSDVVCVDNNTKVLLLPCDLYNFSPKNKFRAIATELKEQKIIHFKDSRKRLMYPYWNTYLAPRELRSNLLVLLGQLIKRIRVILVAFRELAEEKKSALYGLGHKRKKGSSIIEITEVSNNNCTPEKTKVQDSSVLQ